MLLNCAARLLQNMRATIFAACFHFCCAAIFSFRKTVLKYPVGLHRLSPPCMRLQIFSRGCLKCFRFAAVQKSISAVNSNATTTPHRWHSSIGCGWNMPLTCFPIHNRKLSTSADSAGLGTSLISTTCSGKNLASPPENTGRLHVGQNCHKNKKSLRSKSSQGFFHTVYWIIFTDYSRSRRYCQISCSNSGVQKFPSWIPPVTRTSCAS